MQKFTITKLITLGLIIKHHLVYIYILNKYLVNNKPDNAITHYYTVLTYSTGFLISPILAIEIPHLANGV